MAALCVMLLAACWFDYRKRKIPNALVIIMVFLGTVLSFRSDGTAGIVAFLCRTILMAGLLYFFFKLGTIGAGDVKLFGVTAGYLPFEKIFYFLFVSLLIAAIISLIKLLKSKNLAERLEIFMKYSADVWKSRSLKLYPAECASDSYRGICLSGPILLSLLLYLGGVY